ncbi:protein-ER retention protein [Recurvomyces mirabilis]|uniref:Protein-ER retention protein n=1 Tax=Recurvomyces mirabilis TaxID=574656 RepID=A0AAE0WTL7_9PEZI|nr:protein-ER retention protein [Recurvomyces mirabilis]KAK5157308.1 protein-ER retention protein [Recurvomyces mirabilis]
MADLDTEPISYLDPYLPLFPLPVRLSSLVILGIWLYGINLRIFHDMNLDTATLLSYPTSPNHRSVFRLAAILSLILGISTATFWTVTGLGDVDLAQYYLVLPNITLLLILLLVFVLPNRILWPKQIWPTGRTRLRHTLLRIGIGGLAPEGSGRFGDILLADALTSYARPITEIYLSFRLLFTSADLPITAKGKVNREVHPWFLLLLFSWPFLIRMRQCHIANQPANLLKYATSIAVLAMSMIYSQDPSDPWAAWGLPVAAVVNTCYSFYWDVAHDWDLNLFFMEEYPRPSYPIGLRQRLLFSTWKYYAIIALDLVLRFMWTVRFLAPHFNGTEHGIFVVEVLEIVRRFLWTFFRVEAEQLRKLKEPSDTTEMEEQHMID